MAAAALAGRRGRPRRGGRGVRLAAALACALPPLLLSGAAVPPLPAAPRPGPAARRWPSVGVLISTFERPGLLLEALAQVAAQDYGGDVEAVVVDDSAESLEGRLEAERAGGGDLPPLRYIYLGERATIGAKRNLAARSTAAEVLCVWDDDDVFTRHRLRRQVEHLLGWDGGGGVPCSGIEVAYMYSVPTRGLSFRPPRLPQLVFENTLCFTRDWWTSGGHGFGEPWEVSGQGEGTLEPWWEQVCPLTGDQAPFLYIYLHSSVSGGTPIFHEARPAPDERIFALVRALECGHFPDSLRGPHVRGVLEGTRAGLERLLADPGLFDRPQCDYQAFCARYGRAQSLLTWMSTTWPGARCSRGGRPSFLFAALGRLA